VPADFTGFTRSLARSELEQAHDILPELLQLVAARLQPHLTVAEIEGDAAFTHAPAGAIPRGETLLDLIDRTYVEAILVHTTCGIRVSLDALQRLLTRGARSPDADAVHGPA